MLSVIIITKNEALHIERCLHSVAWADEIVVLDSGSTDATVAIAKQFTPKVIQTDWPGFGLQKQRALDLATGDWVLSIDADETVSAALKVEIEQAMTQAEVNGYEIPRLSSYCGKEIRHAGWWPDYVLRLFRRESGYFTEHVVHERVIVDGQIARLSTPFLHEAFVDLTEVLDKVNHYSSLGARSLNAKGVKSSVFKAIYKGGWSFFKTYVLQTAFLDGNQGLMLAISNAEGSYYKYLKLYELQQRR